MRRATSASWSLLFAALRGGCRDEVSIPSAACSAGVP